MHNVEDTSRGGLVFKDMIEVINYGILKVLSNDSFAMHYGYHAIQTQLGGNHCSSTP